MGLLLLALAIRSFAEIIEKRILEALTTPRHGHGGRGCCRLTRQRIVGRARRRFRFRFQAMHIAAQEQGTWSWRGSHCDRWYIGLIAAIGGCSCPTAAAGLGQSHCGRQRQHVEVQMRLRSHRNGDGQRCLAVKRVSSIEILAAALRRHSPCQSSRHCAIVVDATVAATGGQRVRWHCHSQSHARSHSRHSPIPPIPPIPVIPAGGGDGELISPMLVGISVLLSVPACVC